MQIDHVGVAVRSVDAAAERLCGLLGYTRRTAPVTNSRQKVTVLFLSKPGSLDIKLIAPSEDDSPLWDFVRKGGGLHHLAFKVSDVAAATAELAGRGARVLAQPAPGEAFDEHPIAFCYLGLGLNVELIDTDTRRSIIDAAAEEPAAG
jgi:methylmalonyl-CoA/ethylmalonyl-CoA epimerase